MPQPNDNTILPAFRDPTWNPARWLPATRDEVPIMIGGIEACLRSVTRFDYCPQGTAHNPMPPGRCGGRWAYQSRLGRGVAGAFALSDGSSCVEIGTC